jgi:asparagine synthetase B (glutamine-hydrolysing)
MTDITLVGSLDANFAWDGKRLYEANDFAPSARVPVELRGAAVSVAFETPSSWRIIRDPLGINKLFWAPTPRGITLAARPKTLVDQGCAFDAIRAIPRGSVIDLAEDGSETEVHQINPVVKGGRESPPGEFAGPIRSVLDQYIAAIAETHRGARFFVCLSGGLDSSGIAALARDHLPGVTAVSFDLERSGEESEDRRVARKLAHDLDLPLMCVTPSSTSLLEKLDVVLEEASDWRDFNVHAGLVNAALAEAIAESDNAAARKIVLTGDLANEFLADYHEERYCGATYYELPRLPLATLRDVLFRGLDTSHREVGVFAAWAVDVVQPYATAVDLYLRLPGSLLTSPEAKQEVGRAVFGDRLPDYIYRRPKVRAQVGSSQGDRGVLGICIDNGIDAEYLRNRFATIHNVTAASLNRFIRGGTYRSDVPVLSRLRSRDQA